MGRDGLAMDADRVTFRGRGLALRAGSRFVLLICPLCSQRNARRGAERGICEWCSYEPSPVDAEPLQGAEVRSSGR